jgi:hypothetical protein
MMSVQLTAIWLGVSDGADDGAAMIQGAALRPDRLKQDGIPVKIEELLLAGRERETLKLFFSKVRNPIGHGLGSGELTEHQTIWAVELCMTWIKSLIRRM